LSKHTHFVKVHALNFTLVKLEIYPLSNYNKYEALLIFKSNFENEGLDGVLTKVEGDFKNNNAKIFRIDKVGRKKLAYEIQKSREGLIAVVGFEAEGASIKPLTAILNLNEELIRVVILRNDDLDVSKPFIVTPVTGREPRELRGGRGGSRGGRDNREGGRPRRPRQEEGAEEANLQEEALAE
jgi:small subunit ribosomal protein S6